MSDKVYSKRFRFYNTQLEYDFQIRKRHPWWWLLLLFPLLLLIQCHRDVTFRTLADKDTVMPFVEVQAEITEHQLFKDGRFFYKKEHQLSGTTDSNGLLTFVDHPYSVYDYIFFNLKRLVATASKGEACGSAQYIFHWHRNPFDIYLNNVKVHVIDDETGDDIPGAQVYWKKDVEDNVETDAYGWGAMKGVACSDVLSYVTAKAKGYADTTLSNVDVAECMKSDTAIVVRLRPIDVSYSCDIVMIFDNTGSMRNVINSVKSNILTFPDNLSAYCSKRGKRIGEFRIKIIAFGDLEEYPINESRFFHLPGEEESLSSMVSGIPMTHGLDSEEDALEAIAVALKSGWGETGSRRRQIIMVYTDADVHPLGTNAMSPHYPVGIPSSLDEMKSQWDAMDNRTKRMVLYVPADNSRTWKKISKKWSRVHLKSTPLDKVFSKRELESVMESIYEIL